MEYVIIWLLFGIVSAVAASNKGRSGCGWFLLGVLLGPFAIILVLIIPNLKEIEKEKTLEQNQSRRVPCPNCAESILPEAKVCHYCGYKLGENWYQHPEPEPTEPYLAGRYVASHFGTREWIVLSIIVALVIYAVILILAH